MPGLLKITCNPKQYGNPYQLDVMLACKVCVGVLLILGSMKDEIWESKSVGKNC